MVMTISLAPLQPTFPASRLALHRVAAYVVSPARRQAMGRMGLRAAPGGFATPTFSTPNGMASVAVTGTDVEVSTVDGSRRAGLTTLAEAGEFVGTSPDVAWAAELDIPIPGDLSASLSIEPADAAALAAWYAFGWSILEELSLDPASVDPSDPQLWPEHFDPAIEIGSDAARHRASYGFSPGDVTQSAEPGAELLPYVYVAPWYADDRPDSELWNAGRLAVLRYEDLVGIDNPRAVAKTFLTDVRTLLQGA